MVEQKKIKGKVEVFVGKAIKIIADIESDEEILSSLSNLEKIKDQLIKFDKIFCQERIPPVVGSGPKQESLESDNPFEKIANMLNGLTAEDLKISKIFSIKDQNVQLLKPNQFKNVTDAICVLLFILETGVGSRDIKYDIFRDIYESQSIKSGSPLRMLMTNMKVAKYIDGKKYNSKIISLTPKGQEQAISVLNKFSKT